MIRKIFHNLLVLAFMCVFSMTTIAATWQDYGNYDIKWYNASDKEFSISTAAQLAGVAYLVNNGYTNFKSKTLQLTEDIKLSGKTWVPIGNSGFPFRGTFDGNGKKITNIYINKNSVPDPYENYGFFGYVTDANIRNLYLDGELTFKIDDYYTEQYLGGLAAQILYSKVTNCHSELSVCYDRQKASNFEYNIYVGGLVGYSYFNTFENCSYKSSLKGGIGGLYATVESNNSSYLSSGFYLGGLCACDYKSRFNYCTVEISQYLMNIAGSVNSVMGMFAGGMIAYCEGTGIFCSRSIIDDVIMRDRGSKTHDLYFNGLSYLPVKSSPLLAYSGIYNCYSVVKKLEFVGPTIHTSVYYGGISSEKFYNSASSYYLSNYSNKDYYLNSYSMPNYTGYMGLTTFDSETMKTDAFCDELNLYFTLKGEIGRWILADDPYPIIKDTLPPAGINEVYTDTTTTQFSIYNISGICVMQNATREDIQNLSPGIYIINHRKILVK